ncbi:MAG: lipoyl synthase [Candidatus Omnitrophica bacterium]|nr:lipoyl synthase [Candidatus Omnitrophota bacterium]
MKKPLWLNKKLYLGYSQTRHTLKSLNLNTVCEEARCPNISECFSKGTATFMILGNICTRNCLFCAVNKGKPYGIDYSEADRILEAVKKLNLNYLVITSPTRDDLDDGGAYVFYRTVKILRENNPNLIIELLVPDFLGKIGSIKLIVKSGANVIGHNLETVPFLYSKVRPEGDYKRSLEVLRLIKKLNPTIITKSALLLGLGETCEQIFDVFSDLREVGCDWLTLGQYLAPSLQHHTPQEYVSIEKFLLLEKKARKLGFKAVISSPYARSSYFSSLIFKELIK